MMGDILQCGASEVTLEIEAIGAAPIERMEIRNGQEVLETVRPYAAGELGRRIRVLWEGSEYRGRGRHTVWDGGATLRGNTIERIAPINMWNLDKQVELVAPDRLKWGALTTGNFGGFDAWLTEPRAGTLKIDTPLVKAELAVAEIGFEDRCFAAGGIGRRLRVFRLPDENRHRQLKLTASGETQAARR